jgi:hypothetical protein
MEQPVGVGSLQVAFDSFGTELALVKGEVVPGFKANDLVVFDFKLEAALLAAKAAVGLDEFVWLSPGVQPQAAAVGQRGAEGVFNWNGLGGNGGHFLPFSLF